MAPLRAQQIQSFRSEFAHDVVDGLTKAVQKTLPHQYLYDDLGSSLFEAITCLPEYGATRAEERLFTKHAREMTRCLRSPQVIAELGSGSGRKTRSLLEALDRPVRYLPIDISAEALRMCEARLRHLPNLTIRPLLADYREGLRRAASQRSSSEGLAVLFLGSTIGNMDTDEAVAFLRYIRKILRAGDCLLVGTDLMKAIPRLLQAYADPLGVTAAFNLNLLLRVNRELDANFDLAQFEHVASFNYKSVSVEMHLRSRRSQEVRIRATGTTVSFRPGETIRTESSHKYRPNEIVELAEAAGFRCDGQWIDDEWAFAESVFVAS